MKRSKQLLGAVSSFALVALSASPALAAGTTAGDSITNNVSVSFQVGGVTQTAVTDSDTFTVDQKINFTVTETDSTTTSVSPGQTQAVTTFEVTNLSNDIIDIGLAVTQPGTDDYDVSNVKIYLDNGTTPGVFDAGDTEITYLDEIGEDQTVTVFVVADIPNDTVVSTGDVSQVVLTGTAKEGGTALTEGATLTNSTGANTAGVDTVLADTGNDGVEADTDSYTVSAAALSVVKTSRLISDPINGATNPKAIPGAVVEYCIAVSNAAGSATATGVTVTDTMSVDTTYDATFGIFLDGTVDGGGACQADGSAGGSHSAGTVSGTLSDIGAGVTRTLYFRATIN